MDPIVISNLYTILFQYFSEIAQNPESNRRLEVTPGPVGPLGPSKPPWPAFASSSSSRESSPFSSKTSDSTRDSVYGHNKEYSGRGSRLTPQPTARPVEEPENIYATIGPPSTKGDRLSSIALPPAPSHSSMEHIYSAVPALAGSSATISSASTEATGSNTATALSHESIDSDSSINAGFVKEKVEEEEQSSILANFHAQLNAIKQESDAVKLPPEPPKPEPPSDIERLRMFAAQLSKIKQDCDVKEEKETTIPAYMSKPEEVEKDRKNRSPYRIASLAATMPPAKTWVQKEPSPGECLSWP